MPRFFTYILLCGLLKQPTCGDGVYHKKTVENFQQNLPFPSLSSSLTKLPLQLLHEPSNLSSLSLFLSPSNLLAHLAPGEFVVKPLPLLSLPPSFSSSFVLPHPQHNSPSDLPHSHGKPQPPQSFSLFDLTAPPSLRKQQLLPPVSKLRSVDPPWDPNVPNVVNPPKGTKADKYLCSLLKMDVPLCSCVIISKTFALTACDYCMRGTNTTYIPEDFTMLYGVSNIEDNEKMDPFSHRVQRLIRHPRCYSLTNVYTPNFDIGIIQVFKEVQLAPRYFVRLPKNVKDKWDAKQHLHLSNLRTYDTFPASHMNSVWHVLTQKIDKSFSDLLETKEVGLNNICISYHHMGGRSGCQVDIGSPLTVRRNRTADKLIGLLVNKAGCGRPGSVGSCVVITASMKWVRWQVSLYSNDKEFV